MRPLTSRPTSLAPASAVLAALSVLSATALALGGGAGTAHAQTVYNDVTSFNAAAPGNTLYTFEGIAPSGSYATDPNLSPLTFSVTGGAGGDNVYAVSKTFSNGLFCLNGTDGIAAGQTNDAANPAITRIDLGGTGATFTAFATEIGQSHGYTNQYLFALYLGNTQVGTTYSSAASTPSDTFVGFTSTLPFDNVRVTTTQNRTNLTLFDNMRTSSVASSAAAPEPASVALLALSGLPVVGAIVRRRRHSKAA